MEGKLNVLVSAVPVAGSPAGRSGDAPLAEGRAARAEAPPQLRRSSAGSGAAKRSLSARAPLRGISWKRRAR